MATNLPGELTAVGSVGKETTADPVGAPNSPFAQYYLDADNPRAVQGERGAMYVITAGKETGAGDAQFMLVDSSGRQMVNVNAVTTLPDVTVDTLPDVTVATLPDVTVDTLPDVNIGANKAWSLVTKVVEVTSRVTAAGEVHTDETPGAGYIGILDTIGIDMNNAPSAWDSDPATSGSHLIIVRMSGADAQATEVRRATYQAPYNRKIVVNAGMLIREYTTAGDEYIHDNETSSAPTVITSSVAASAALKGLYFSDTYKLRVTYYNGTNKTFNTADDGSDKLYIHMSYLKVKVS
jgi:hypothetical protein